MHTAMYLFECVTVRKATKLGQQCHLGDSDGIATKRKPVLWPDTFLVIKEEMQ